ncbi:hypothetical protein DXG01_009315 [Tephrocybe rancida]|nr:hypothetical protein DXG01_009315 [Tephrocybe rancida]
MTTFVQGSSRMAADDSRLKIQAAHDDAQFWHDMPNKDLVDHGNLAFRVLEVDRTLGSAIETVYANPQRNMLDDVIQDLERLSLFGRTTAQVFLDPTLQRRPDVQFKNYTRMATGELVPVIHLDDMKLRIPPASPPAIIQEFSPSPPARTPNLITKTVREPRDPPLRPPVLFGADQIDQEEIPLNPPPLLFGADQIDEELRDQEEISFNPTSNTVLHSAGTADVLSADQRVFAEFVHLLDAVSDDRAPEFLVGDNVTQEVPGASEVPCIDPSQLTMPSSDLLPLLQECVRDEQATHSTYLSFDFGPSDNRSSVSEKDLSTLQYSHSGDRLLSDVLNHPYPFPEMAACASLPFPIVPVHDTALPIHGLDDLDGLLNQGLLDGIDWQAAQPLSSDNFFPACDWPSPPTLSPSYTDSSQDSTLYTPTNGQSPIVFSFTSPESRLAALNYQHELPSREDVLSWHTAPQIEIFEDLFFEETFDPYHNLAESSRRRVTHKAAEVHEQIAAQVAPYTVPEESVPIPKEPSKAKDKGKGKAKANDDEGSDEPQEPKKKGKKKKRGEADKVKCEFEGCNGTFFSNWELKRHQKNVHAIGGDESAAVCPKCGRKFASGRKDSVDRHLELGACGKRNPRKPPKNRPSSEDTA